MTTITIAARPTRRATVVLPVGLLEAGRAAIGDGCTLTDAEILRLALQRLAGITAAPVRRGRPPRTTDQGRTDV
jgi:hypothetical protein